MSWRQLRCGMHRGSWFCFTVIHPRAGQMDGLDVDATVQDSAAQSLRKHGLTEQKCMRQNCMQRLATCAAPCQVRKLGFCI